MSNFTYTKFLLGWEHMQNSATMEINFSLAQNFLGDYKNSGVLSTSKVKKQISIFKKIH